MYSYHPAGVVTSKQLAVSGGSTVTASYTYDNAGRTVTRTYPVAIGGATQSDTFTSTFDGMGRPVTLTGSESPSPLTWVQNVQYDFAGRMSSLQYLVSPTSSGYTTEAKGFNANGQLTSIGWTGSASPVTGSLQYGYSATQNNGQIAQVVDSISGETIVYQYDSLKRLTSAASVPSTGSPVAAWTQTFQYDGFGNQTAQVLNGTTTAIAVNAATNQLSGASYDSNGNMTSGVGATFTFDVGNRVLSAAEISGGVEYYGYAPDNKRIYKKLTSGAEEYTFFGGQGEKLGVYNLTGGTMSALRTNVWFAGKLISENSNAVFQDRVGTNRASGARFHPYGDEITSTANDREKFATYTRDSYTGVDYADQRYYASSYGRFNTPDPDGGSAKTSKPGSWNRFAYVSGDPVNLRDGRGLEEDDCSQDYEEDGTIDEGCCLPTAWWSGGEEGYACSTGGGPSGGGGSPLCFAIQEYRPVDSSSALLSLFNHTYFYVGDSYGNQYVLEGLPQNNPPQIPGDAWGTLMAHTFPVTSNGVVPQDTKDNPFDDYSTGEVTGSNTTICNIVSLLEAKTHSFDGGTYDPTAVFGSNSNTFAAYLAGLTGQNLGTPPAAPGY